MNGHVVRSAHTSTHIHTPQDTHLHMAEGGWAGLSRVGIVKKVSYNWKVLEASQKLNASSCKSLGSASL